MSSLVLSFVADRKLYLLHAKSGRDRERKLSVHAERERETER
jgi:hypothetical protein